MADEADPGPLTLWWVAAYGVILLLIVLLIVRLELPEHQVLEHVFAALVDVFFVGVVLYLLLFFHRKEQSRRLSFTASADQLEEFRARLWAARALLDAHRSAKTWKEQMQLLMPFRSRLERLAMPTSHRLLSRSDEASTARANLKDWQTWLQQMENEYMRKHEEMARRQEQYEHSGKLRADRQAQFEANWRDLQRIAQTSLGRLLNLEGNQAAGMPNHLEKLDESIEFLRTSSGVRRKK